MNSPDIANIAGSSGGRARLYRLFSRLTRQEATPEVIGALRGVQPDISRAARLWHDARSDEGATLLGQFLQQVNTAQQVDGVLLELSGEYVDLFILGGPGSIKPYESVYSSGDGLLMQAARDRALAAYRRAGMLPAGIYHEPEDHLAIELEFMAHLCQEGADKEQVSFLEDHLLSWVPELCARLGQRARSPLYKGLAELLAGFLALEKKFVVAGNMVEKPVWSEALTQIASSSGWQYFLEGEPLLRKPVDPRELNPRPAKVVLSGCAHDCGARCPLKVHVEDGRIVRIMPSEAKLVELRPCIRGLLYHYRAYSPDRLKYPLKRVGKRGEGKFIRISWDEALDTVAKEIARVRDTYGPGSILGFGSGGSIGRFQNRMALQRLLNMAGGHSDKWGNASAEGAIFGTIATYGTVMTGNERDDLLNSRMIVLWGTNPAESLFGNSTRRYLMLAKEKGIKIVCVDPRYSDSTAGFASEWIPIRPGTDTAMLVAMAYVIIRDKLHDKKFLDTYTVGFDKYRDYVTGTEDGIPKTPAWAEAITRVPAPKIEELAVRYARSKPAAIIAGFAPGRTASGEQFHRAAMALCALTGNVGIHGGGVGGLDAGFRETQGIYDLPDAPNPVALKAPPRQRAFTRAQSAASSDIHISHMFDAILRGKEGGYRHDYKLVYIVCSNAVNQYAGTNVAVEALQKPEFIVMHEQFMTPTAKFADILLPAAMWPERSDITLPFLMGAYAIYANKATEPLFASRTDLEICTGLAARLGIPGFNDRTEDDWLRFVAQKNKISDYDTFKEKGLDIIDLPEPHVAFRAQIEDPERNKFPTPSGKIEIYCQELADLGVPDTIPPIPKYIEMWEGADDPVRERFPLQLITTHSRKRVHSQFDNIPWLHNVEPHAVWINPDDAKSRRIANGDMVRVHNERGALLIPAKVTARIMPGVVCIYEGAWYNPDSSGLDRGGCANVLTRPEHSPGGAHASNTSLVQVTKAD